MNPCDHPDLCWIFLDTTGLDPDKDEVIGYTIMRSTNIVGGAFMPVMYEHVLAYDALIKKPLVHDMNRRLGKSEVSEISDAMSGAMLAGCNVEFSMRFLRRLFEGFDVAVPNIQPQRIDLMHLFAPMKLLGLLDSTSLKAIAKALDCSPPDDCSESRMNVATHCYNVWVREFVAK